MRRPGGLVSRKIPDRGNQISIQAVKNLKIATFMFKMIEHCSKAYDIGVVNITSVMQYQHQWELEQKKSDNTEAFKVDKDNWAKTMESIELHLKLIREMRGTLLASVVWFYIKVAHILPG